MLLTRRKHLWRQRSRSLFTCIAVAAYLTTSVGFPLPASSGKDPGQPNSCQGHVCGCSSTQQRLGQCCCCKPKQKFDSAQADDIEPPSCCERRLVEPTSPPATPIQGKKPSDFRWVLGVSALQCQGLSTSWIAAGAVVPPPPALTWSPFWPLAGWLWFADAKNSAGVVSPPDRPPRST